MIALFAILLASAVVGELNDTADDSVVISSTASIPSRSRSSPYLIADGVEEVDVSNATASSAVSKPTRPASDFQSDCSDPHNKEIACSVHVVDCAEKLFDDASWQRTARSS